MIPALLIPLALVAPLRAPPSVIVNRASLIMLADGVPPPERPQSNPFYAAYDDDELAELWDIHSKLFGAADDAAEEPPPEEVGGEAILGGLHAAVLQTIAEGEAEAAAAAEPEDAAPLDDDAS